MTPEARELMCVLADGILADELLAAQFVSLAELMDSSGERQLADVFQEGARHHRVEALKLRARLGAMVEQYGVLHLPK